MLASCITKRLRLWKSLQQYTIVWRKKNQLTTIWCRSLKENKERHEWETVIVTLRGKRRSKLWVRRRKRAETGKPSTGGISSWYLGNLPHSDWMCVNVCVCVSCVLQRHQHMGLWVRVALDGWLYSQLFTPLVWVPPTHMHTHTAPNDLTQA